MKSLKHKLVGLVAVVALVCGLVPAFAYADGATLESVLAAIGNLPNDVTTFTVDDKAGVEAINADYESLSAEDQAKVDSTFNHPSGDGQSYGRILESSVWAVRSFDTDTSTTLTDGTYTPKSSLSDKGKSDSSRTRNWWVESVTVANGQATAKIYVTGGAATAKKVTSYPSVWAGGVSYPKADDHTYTIPVDLNGTTYFGGVSSSMPRPIMYSLETVIDEPAPAPEAIELAITNNTGMFRAETASVETDADGAKTLVMALSSDGYKILVPGTYEQAVAGGDSAANWVQGYQNADGKWEFRIPLGDGQQQFLPVVAVSNSYYTKYKSGQNSLERSFYPRQLAVDLAAKTLVTGDYEFSKDLAVTNNVKMFKPGTTATLHTVGGPNSNNYAADLVLPMGSDAMSEVFVGSIDEANDAGTGIAFNSEDNTFTIKVKWVETFGQPETMKSLCDGKPFYMCFKSKKNSQWYERKVTLNEEAGTLVFDPSEADYSAVDAAKDKAAALTETDYTAESWAKLQKAIAAVETDKCESQQAAVDAMAKAIEDAIAALEKDAPAEVVEVTAASELPATDGRTGAQFTVKVPEGLAGGTLKFEVTGVGSITKANVAAGEATYAVPVAPKNLSDPFTITYTKGDEVIDLTGAYTTVAKAFGSDAYGAAMADYGMMADNYLRNAAHEASSAVAGDTVSGYAKKTTTDGSVDGLKDTGYSLVHNSKLYYKQYFTLEGDVSDYTVTVNGKDATLVASGSEYYVKVPAVKSSEWNDTVEVVVTKAGEGIGDEEETYKVTFSATTYAQSKATSSKAALSNLAKAMDLFYKAAVA